MLTGSLVAIATPMQEDGALDLPALRKLIDFHVAAGTDGIVVVGTTGESPTVDVDEHCLLIKTAVEHAAGPHPRRRRHRRQLDEGGDRSSRNSRGKRAPSRTCRWSRDYNKPTQEGLYRHFRTIAENVALPMVLYNVPGRTVADLATETTLRLAQVPNIVGVKDATADFGRGSELLSRARRRRQA